MTQGPVRGRDIVTQRENVGAAVEAIKVYASPHIVGLARPLVTLMPGDRLRIMTPLPRADHTVQICLRREGENVFQIAGAYLWIHEDDLDKIMAP